MSGSTGRDGTGANRPPTMKAIAEWAGVGLGTVSRALARTGQDVSPETRAKVRRAARELGYRPSALGRGLKLQRTDTIGLLVADISNSFYGEFAQSVLEAAEAVHRHVIVGSSGEDPDAEAAYVDLLLEQRVDGIIAFPTTSAHDGWVSARKLGTKIVFADRLLESFDVTSVSVDNVRGMRDLTSHLIELGHREIAYLGGPMEISSGRGREEGYLQALRAAGLEPDPSLVVRHGFTRDASDTRLVELLRERRPTALVASNNVLGEEALAAMGELGLRYPDDLSFVMFDDVPWARLTSPAITVQEQPTRELGRLAVRAVLEDHPTPVAHILGTTLRVRDSTRPPRD